jgi:release factor glutamine methyltransferase
LPSTIRQALSQAHQQLKLALALDEREARLESRLLLGHTLQQDYAWLIAHESDALEANIHAVFEASVKRRVGGEPIAYILGYREFYGLDLKVTPATLIPRPDTEVLVEAALAKIPLGQSTRVLDLGTGTGAIALAIARNRPHAIVTAVDASAEALAVAQENALRLHISNVRFVLSNWFEALNEEDGSGKYNIIVSNPPYIATGDVHLEQGDLRFEPPTALASGSDGLDDIRRIIKASPAYLQPDGWLMLEHGYDQSTNVSKLLKIFNFNKIDTAKDLANIDRVTFGKNQALSIKKAFS